MQGSQEDYCKANIERHSLVETSICSSCRSQAHGQAPIRWTNLGVRVSSPESIVRFSQQRMECDHDEKVGHILSEARVLRVCVVLRLVSPYWHVMRRKLTTLRPGIQPSDKR